MKTINKTCLSLGTERSIKLFTRAQCIRAYEDSEGGDTDEEIAAFFNTSAAEARGMIDAGHELTHD